MYAGHASHAGVGELWLVCQQDRQTDGRTDGCTPDDTRTLRYITRVHLNSSPL